MNPQTLQTIKETVEEFFQKMTFEVEVDLMPVENETIPVNLKTDEPQILIGEGGQTLNEIQRLLKAILKRKISEPFFLNLDINGYKKKKAEHLKDLAQSLADEVFLSKKEKILPPMSAYERRIIHLELAGRSDIMTESIGQEPERKIILKPRP